jgi:hypothetical protein
VASGMKGALGQLDAIRTGHVVLRETVLRTVVT